MLTRIFSCLLVLTAGTPLRAQPIQTLYYENGAKAAEGHWRYTSSALFSTNYYEGHNLRQRDPEQLDAEIFNSANYYLWGHRAFVDRLMLNLVPEGRVTTFYRNGGKKAEINYAGGVATGPYTEYYRSGRVAFDGALECGMPTGEWKVYDANGYLYCRGRYAPYTDSALTALWQVFAEGWGTMGANAYRQKTAPVDDPLDTVETDEAKYTVGIRALANRYSPGLVAQRVGVFRFYTLDGRGLPQATATFRDDRRDGIWKIWDYTARQREPIELEYRLGELLTIRDSTGKYTVPQYVAAQKRAEEKARKKAEAEERKRAQIAGPPPPVIMMEPESPAISFVDQRADFKGNIKLWLKANLRNPNPASSRKRPTDVMVRFMLDANGTVRDPVVMRAANDAEFNKEALRVVQSMPAWKPARINGQAVPVFQTITIDFSPPAAAVDGRR